jgi:predicted nucleic acid-binding protein
VTVLDTSAAIDFLLGEAGAPAVEELLSAQAALAAPDVMVFEVLAVLRRDVLRGTLTGARASGAIDDLGDLSVTLFPSLALRARAWELRDNFTAADALFVALAEALDEPLATKDSGLAMAARRHTAIATLEVAGP